MDIKQQRAYLRSREAAVKRKIKRIEQSGVDIRGTEFDPIRKGAPVHRYNQKQIESYVNKLNAFVNRRNQYVGDTFGRPIPIAEWREYVKVQTKNNVNATREWNRVKDVDITPTGLTISQRKAMSESEFPYLRDVSKRSPFKLISRVPENIASRQTLKKLTRDMQAKVSPGAMKLYVEDGRMRLAKMLKISNRPELQARVDALSDKAFHVLWAYTTFADDIAQDYAYMSKDAEDRSRGQVLETNNIEQNELIDWADKLDFTKGGVTSGQTRKTKPKAKS